MFFNIPSWESPYRRDPKSCGTKTGTGDPYHIDLKSWRSENGTRLMQKRNKKIRDRGQTFLLYPLSLIFRIYFVISLL